MRVEAIHRMVFREPDGPRQGLVFSLFSLICIVGWVYFGLILNGPHIMLFLSIAFAFSGGAESFPPTRQRLAGAFRMLGLGVLAVLIVLLIGVPGSILVL